MYHTTFFHGKIFCLNIKFGVLTAQETWKNNKNRFLGIWDPFEKMNFLTTLGSSTILSPTTLLDHFQPGVQQITAQPHTALYNVTLTELRQLLTKVLHQKYLLLSSLMRLNDLKFRTNEFWISTKQNHCKTTGTVPLQRPASQSSRARTASTSEEQRIPVFPGIKV